MPFSSHDLRRLRQPLRKATGDIPALQAILGHQSHAGTQKPNSYEVFDIIEGDRFKLPTSQPVGMIQRAMLCRCSSRAPAMTCEITVPLAVTRPGYALGDTTKGISTPT